MGFGDPHYSNLDNTTYTFNGCGDFMFTSSNDSSFQTQVRFTQATGAGLGTVISALVLKLANVVPIQVNQNKNGEYFSRCIFKLCKMKVCGRLTVSPLYRVCPTLQSAVKLFATKYKLSRQNFQELLVSRENLVKSFGKKGDIFLSLQDVYFFHLSRKSCATPI